MKTKRMIAMSSMILIVVVMLFSLVVQAESITGAEVGIGGSQAGIASSVQAEAVRSCVRCKNVDMVWQTIQGKLGLRDDAATKVWDTTQKKWRLYIDVYREPGTRRTSAFNAISQMGFSETTYLEDLIAEAERQGMDPCFPLVVARMESEGKTDIAQAEANLPLCSSGERWKFLIDRSPNCQGKTVRALIDLCLDNRDPAIVSRDVPRRGVDNCLDDLFDTRTYKVTIPTKEQFCSGNFDKSYRYALGLGQINVFAGNDSRNIQGVDYTHCELMDPQKNIQATVRLLKSIHAGLDTTEAAVRRVFGSYGGSEQSPGVTRRYELFQQCKQY